MTLLESASVSTLGTVALLSLAILVIRRIWISKSFPTAPGPEIAAFTDWWYLWKVYGGDFEKWNIKQHAQHGSVIRVAPRMYSISDPASIPTIYGISSQMPKSSWYKAFGDPTVPNHNLFNATDRTIHAGMRRKTAHLYSMTSISKYEPYIDNCIPLLFKNLDGLADRGEMMDVQHWMQCYAFDVIGEITFGSRVGFLESGGQDIDGIMGKIDKVNTLSTVIGIDIKAAPFLLLKGGNPVSVIGDWIDKATKIRVQRSDDEKDAHEAEDFFSKLQTAKEKDPEDYVRYRMENAIGANIGAGSDTTSISLTAIIFFLATNPQTLSKLRAEMQNAAHLKDLITFEQARDMPYLQLVIKEALRLWPATGLPMWRVVQEPGATIAGQLFPAGSIVGVNGWVSHRDPAVYGPDPDVFRPERWIDSPPNQLKTMEACYIPFGLGTRTCIGKNISILEMTKLIPELVKRRDFEMVEQSMRSTNHWFVRQRDVYARIKRIDLG